MEEIHQSFESKMRQSSCTAQALKIWVTQLNPATRIVRLSPEWIGPLGKSPASSALLPLKGSLTRDFRAQVFFMNQCPPCRAISIPLGPFWIFSKIRRDIRELMFIAGVNDTGEKLFSGVNEKFMTPAINFWSLIPVRNNQRPKIYRQCQRHRRKTVHRCQRHRR